MSSREPPKPPQESRPQGSPQAPPEPPLELEDLLEALRPLPKESEKDWWARVEPLWDEQAVRDALFLGLVERGRGGSR